MIGTNFDPFKDLDRAFGWQPAGPGLPIDVIKRPHEVVVSIELPGFRAEDIEITVERNVLTVSAERNPNVGEGDRVVTRERRWGRASRQLVLSDTLDGGSVDANLDSGVLTLRIPVAEQAKPQRVSIAVGSSPELETTAN